MATALQSLVYNCQFCSFVSLTKKALLKHIKESHVHDHGFFIKCLLCDRSFRVFTSFTSHVSRSHPGVAAESTYQCNSATAHGENDTITDGDDQNHWHFDRDEANHDDVDGNTDENGYPVRLDNDAVAKLSESAGRFIVGLKEKHLVCCIAHTCMVWHTLYLYCMTYPSVGRHR